MREMITKLQAHILDNLERVQLLPYKLIVKAPLPRYKLDGRECTAQINSLVVRGLVAEASEGTLVRTPKAELPSAARAAPILLPQPVHADTPRPSPIVYETLYERDELKGRLLADEISMFLMAPVRLHRDETSASKKAQKSGARGNPCKPRRIHEA